jgi:hypothetical protein
MNNDEIKNAALSDKSYMEFYNAYKELYLSTLTDEERTRYEAYESIMSIDNIVRMKQRVYREWIQGKTLQGEEIIRNQVDQVINQKQIKPTQKQQEEDVQQFYKNLVDIENKPTCNVQKSEMVTLFERWENQENKHVATFEIERTNKGFQILEKGLNWKETGLGSKEQGRLYPIKTVFKRDRLGIGNPSCKVKPRVTHFPSKQYDENGNEIKPKRPYMIEKKRRKQEINLPKGVIHELIKREKQKEEMWRQQVYDRVTLDEIQ